MKKSRALFRHKDWRIVRVGRSLVIERTGDSGDEGSGEVGWAFCGYYSTFSAALHALADKIGHNADTLEDAIRELRDLRLVIERFMQGRE